MSAFWYISRACALIVLMEKFTISEEPRRQLPLIYKDLEILPRQLQKLYEKNAEEEDGYYYLLPVPELILKCGYPVETHTVVSSDGYITTIHRIPHGKKSSHNTTKPVVLLQHGIFLSSGDFVLAGPGQGLGFILADEGYDVWMVNGRGNIYSRNHSYLDPNSAEYWQFSWHEIAVYDTTAAIDYILEITKQEKLFHVGYSQGTTAFYVMCAERPEYNEKIRAHFSLGPIVYVNNVAHPLVPVFSFLDSTINYLAGLLGIHQILPDGHKLLTMIGHYFCSDGSITQGICINVLIFTGFSAGRVNSTLVPQMFANFLVGSSVRQFMHYVQGLSSDQFGQWDHGVTGNLEKYGTEKPPKYELAKVTVPVYLYYSKTDVCTPETEVHRLAKELGNCRDLYLLPDGSGHMEYIVGKHVREIIYDPLLDTMRKHQRGRT